eukprot:jgi/Psemu1/220138/e_gw1.1019.2.1
MVHGHLDARANCPSSSSSSSLASSLASRSVAGIASSDTASPSSLKLSPLLRSVLNVRGGEEEEEDGDEYDDESDSDDEDDTSVSSPGAGMDAVAILEKVVDVAKTKVVPIVADYSRKGLLAAKKTSVMIYGALYRAVQAGLEGDVSEDDEDSDDEDDSDDEEEEVATVADKILAITKKAVKTVQRMVKAAMTIPEEDEGGDDDDESDDGDGENESEVEESAEAEEEDESVSSETTTPDETEDETGTEPTPAAAAAAATNDGGVAASDDFGSYLSESYEVDDLRNSGKAKGPIILDGSLQDALQTAREQARMLLVFIPSEKPKGEQQGVLSFFGGGNKGTAESEENTKVAIESLLSKEVAKASNRKARKKQAGDDFGSFAIWGAKAGSSEAAAAIKRLKVKETTAKGEKRPILCVVYPASSIAPKVLAQHHCNPPLKSESMASWMNALRKRHGKQYEVMQTEWKELQLYKERQEGYIDSVQSDNERKLREAKEAAEQKAREVKEAARQAEIDARRQELRQSLPEDVKGGNNVKKIALRFPDGRSGQRGFAADEPLTVLFNWVDAMFEIERETVVLTTLNGKQTFEWEGDESTTTLEDAGLNRMTALRVSQATKEE